MKLTKAQRQFAQEHLRRPAEDGYLRRFGSSRRTYVFVHRCREIGVITIDDPDDRFPYSWQGTQITPAGRLALQERNDG